MVVDIFFLGRHGREMVKNIGGFWNVPTLVQRQLPLVSIYYFFSAISVYYYLVRLDLQLLNIFFVYGKVTR